MTKDSEPEKKWRLVYTDHHCKNENDITRFYRRFSLAQLHHVTAVKLSKEKKVTAFHEYHSFLGQDS